MRSALARHLIFATVLACAAPAIAAPFCADLFRGTKAHEHVGFSDADARLIRHATKKIDGFLGPLRRPSPIVAKIEAYYFSFFHAELSRIGFAFARKPLRIRSLAVFSHEYGHAIFEANLRITLDGRTQRLAEHPRALTKAMERLENDPEYRALNKRRYQLLFDENNPAELLAIDKRLEAILARESQVLGAKAQAEWEELRFLTLPYDELFADLIAVLHARDPRAVADGFGITKSAPYRAVDEAGKTILEFNDRAYRPRDFTAKPAIETFYPNDIHFAYTFFDPIRAPLWETVSALKPADYGNFLAAYVRATEKHVELRRGKDHTQDALALNAEFLELLLTELSAGAR